jgi:hypothetical protein
MEKIYARLYPFSPRRGYTTRGYSYDGQTYKGGERPNWYCISQDLAGKLKPLLQQHDVEDSKPLFQIVSETEKLQLEATEQDRFLASIGAIGETIAGTRNVAPPPTHDLRPKEEIAKEASVEAASYVKNKAMGRGAAIPKPREHLNEKQRRGLLLQPK